MPDKGSELSQHELLALVPGAAALVVTPGVRIDDEVLANGPGIRIVASAAVGFENIDLAAAQRRGIAVTNTPGVASRATADLTLLLLLATLRRAAEGLELVKHGRWLWRDPDALWGDDPAGLTLGIIGLGRIGREVARRAAVLGMRVVYHSRTPVDLAGERGLEATWLPLETLLSTADVVSLHVPLTPETEHLVNASRISQMRRGAILLNTSRGRVVDEMALCDALESGHLAAVGLDVYEREPAVPARLRRHPRSFLLPHVGTATTGTRRAMFKMAIDNVAAVLTGGAPLSPVVATPAPRSVPGPSAEA